MPLLQPIEQGQTATFMVHHQHTMFDTYPGDKQQKNKPTEAIVEIFKH